MTSSIRDSLTTIPMDQFALKWRFTDPKYDLLPDEHLAQIKPLDEPSARRVWRFISEARLLGELPSLLGFFRHIESVTFDWEYSDTETARIKKWLDHLGIPFRQSVFLAWEAQWAAITTWKMFVKYWNAFYYPSSDDLIIVDEALQWIVFFSHEEEVYFGTNRP